MWRCPKCDEKIPDQFPACWICGTQADGTEDPDFIAEQMPPEQAPSTPAPRDLPPVEPGTAGRRWIEIVVVVVIFVLSGLWLYIQQAEQASWLAGDLLFLVRSLTISAVVLYLIWRSRDPWNSHGISPPRWLDLFSGTLIGIVVLLVTSTVLSVLMELFPALLEEGHENSPVPESALDWTVLVIANLANGFAVELTIRAYVLLRLLQLWGSKGGALLVTSVVSASYHLYLGPLVCAMSLLYGVLLGLTFLLYRRLWPIAWAHAAMEIALYALSVVV